MTKFTHCIIIFIVFSCGNCQDVVYPYYPHGENNVSGVVQKVRGPVYAPNRCPPDQLLYPGDQKDDWICDCRPGFVYSPEHNKCFAIFREGPCGKGFHLILRSKEVIPECVKNPCQDGYARYSDGKCYELGKAGGPCSDELVGGGVFNVNETSLAPECIRQLNPDIFNYIDTHPTTVTIQKSTEITTQNSIMKKMQSRRKTWVVVKEN